MSLSTIRRVCLAKRLHVDFIKVLQVKCYSQSAEKNVVYSKIPDIKIPEMSVNDYIWKDLGKWHNKTAFLCAETGRSYLYSELYKKTQALANFLYSFKGLQRRDTIALVLPNIPEFPIALLGSIQAGLKVTTINPLYTADEIARQLTNSDTKMIFTIGELLPTVKQAVLQASPKEKLPIVVIKHQKDESTPEGCISFSEISEGDHKLKLQLNTSFEDTIILPYSSGTTGLPKGVELTTKNIISNLSQLSSPHFKIHESADGSGQEIIPAILPMFHIFGLVGITLNLLSCGVKFVSIPRFTFNIFKEVLEKHRPTIACLVPPLVLLISSNDQIRPESISQMRSIISGAAPLGAADIKRLEEKTGGKTTVLQGYGLTETSPTVHQQTSMIPNGIKLGGCGFSMPNTECKIVALDDKEEKGLGPNQTGELFVKGPQVMKGYYKNPEATQEVFTPDGWFKTGDMAYYDEDEHFFITERLKELIKVKGFQVAPAELEEILRDHPDVADAAVVGVPHPEFGEVPKAFLIPKKGVKIDSTKVQEFVGEKVAKYKQLIGGVAVIDQIPKSAAGKILRRQLKNL